MPSDDQYDYLYKIVLIGETGVGKTCILSRFTNNTYDDKTKSTIGVEFAYKCVEIDKCIIRAQVWDTAGQERFRAITSAYYRGAVGAMIVFDMTDRNTFEAVQNWYDELKSHSQTDIVVMLVGNKCDKNDERKVTQEEAVAYAEKNNMAYIETSAKTATGIVTAFQSIMKAIYNTMKTNQMQTDKKTLGITPTTTVTFNLKHKQEPAIENKSQCDC